MWIIISMVFVVITSILGITELLRMLWFYTVRPREDLPYLLKVFLKKDIFVQQIRAALEYTSWESTKNFRGITLNTNELSEKELSVVKKMVEENDRIFLENQ